MSISVRRTITTIIKAIITAIITAPGDDRLRGSCLIFMYDSNTRVLVTGAGGFIGSHLVTYLKDKGYWVRGVDLNIRSLARRMRTSSRYSIFAAGTAAFRRHGVEEVYALAADMGGMGFISAHHAQILYNNSLINLHTLEAPESTT